MPIRAARSSDRDHIIRLIDGVLREYGDRVCLGRADADLADLPARYVDAGGAMVVLEDDGVIQGTHAILPIDLAQRVCTMRRLYLAQPFRGSGRGGLLMQWALDWASAHGFRRIDFWSDTRFQNAHRVFQRYGFRQTGRVRTMDDGWQPYQEFFFTRDIGPAPPNEGN